MIKSTYKITKVTVYQDRAQVIRDMLVEAEIGIHEICFDYLPERIEPNSIQVSGVGDASILDVRYDTEYLSEISEEKMRQLSDEIQLIKDELYDLELQTNHSKGEKKFVENIVSKLTASSEKEKVLELDPEKWIKMVQFYRSEMEKLDDEINRACKSIREKKKILKAKQNKWNSAGSSAQKTNKKVIITIDKKADQSVSIALSYMVYGPVWRPNYDIRVNNKNKKITINYQAEVVQNTGEDWKEVELNLSTASVHLGGVQPELDPQYIHLENNKVARKRYYSADVAKPAMMVQMMTTGAEPFDEEIGELVDDVNEDIEMIEADVSSHATAVVFHIPHKKDIMSNSQEHQVKIITESFPAHFRYSTVPRLDEHAYLKAKAVNETDYPLLSGDAKVFMDQQFIANTHLELVNPKQEFWVFLGIDESIQVKYRMVNQYEKKEKLIGKKKTMIYQYKTEITNNKTTKEEIVIWDQIPISKNEDLAVTLTKPSYKQDSSQLKMNDKNFLEWFYVLEPGHKKVIELEYTIEYPGDKRVMGI